MDGSYSIDGEKMHTKFWLGKCTLKRVCEYIYSWIISFTNFNAQLFYSLTICMLHYNPRLVSNINMPIFRRTNCIITASGIVTLCTVLYSLLQRVTIPGAVII
jgi:hypothetical protein